MGASKGKTRPARITAGLVWFHRWLGIATCLIFAIWFASGAVLLFKPFPSLARSDQLALERPIDMNAVRLAPAQAIAAAGGEATSLRLVQRAGRPAYVVGREGRLVAVDAASAAVLPALGPAAAGAKGKPIEYDQWVAHNQFDALRPLYRIERGDSAGTVDYISAITGEPIQRTTFSDRAWNWVGAVLHWVYFTPLRASFTAWDRTVWWLSLVATLVAVAGTILGVMRSAVALRQRKPSLTFYRLKWMRWHHLLGLFAAIFVLAWIFSGWLSMDHGRLFSRGQPSEGQAAGYEGKPLSAVLATVRPVALRRMDGAREIDFGAVGGAPVVTAYGGTGVARFDGEGNRLGAEALARQIDAGVREAWPGASLARIEDVAPRDMYALAEGWPRSVRRVVLAGGAFPDLYVDGDSGRILTVMDDSRAAYAWVYYALHTFNFPGLTTHPLLREILVLVPLLLGFVFCITGVVVGWQRLRKSLF